MVGESLGGHHHSSSFNIKVDFWTATFISHALSNILYLGAVPSLDILDEPAWTVDGVLESQKAHQAPRLKCC